MDDYEIEDVLRETITEELRRDHSIVPILAIGISFFALVILLLFILPGYLGAQETGTALGNTAGALAGSAIGSAEGITKGQRDGTAAGRNAGTNAKDTTVVIEDIRSDLGSMGKLEVLLADIILENIMTIGEKYKALYLLNATAVFTVDLNLATIQSTSDQEIVVSLPAPECHLDANPENAVKEAEYSKHSSIGSSQDGYGIYLNSWNQVIDKSSASLQSDEHMQQQAKDAALQQIQLLVKTITGDSKRVSVNFQDGR